MNRRYNTLVAMIVLSLLGAGAPERAVAAQTTTRESPHKKVRRSCEKCHVATSFKDIRFDHSETAFSLTGPHAGINCLDCHNVEDFSKVEATCATCHEDAHLGRMGNACEQCHTSTGWRIFDAEGIHATSDFPLFGRHVFVDCESCHSGMTPARLRGTPTDCISCHRVEYEETVNPNHSAGGFSTECLSCHQFSAWNPASFGDHDPLFPIFAGRHRGVWSDCAQCHVTPGNPQAFSCLTCHEHEQPLMDPAHQGMTGYAYVSSACYACHPTGEAGEFGDHDPLYFPIYSGRHQSVWNECAQCHATPGNPQAFTCLTCHEHEQPLMDPAHQGMTGYAYVSSACYSCHPTGEAGEFVDHDPLYFPIYSGKHNNKWSGCDTCHEVATNKSQFTCFNCHEHDQARMDDKHLGEIAGYVYTSQACYDCHPDGTKN